MIEDKKTLHFQEQKEAIKIVSGAEINSQSEKEHK